MQGGLPIRRGLGILFILAGVLQPAMLVLPRFFLMTARLWSQLFFGHFLFLVLGGFGWLGLSFFRSGLFHYETLADFLIGVGAFVLILSAAGLFLSRRWLAPWPAILPPGFLLAYGFGLWRGRRYGFGAEN